MELNSTFDLPPQAQALLKKSIECESYINSFVDLDSFSEKRFERYVDKAEKWIIENFLKPLFPIGFDKEKNGGTILYKFEDVIADIIREYYDIKFNYADKNIRKGVWAVAYQYFMNSEDLEYDHKTKGRISKWLKCESDFQYSFDRCIYNEVRNACKQYIKEKSSYFRDVDETNYFKTLPASGADAMRIISLTINFVIIDMERICKSEYVNAISEVMRDDALNKAEKELTDANKKIQDLEQEVKQLLTTIESLREINNEAYSVTSEDVKAISELSNRCTVLQRQNNKMIRVYNSLLEKYNNLKSSCGVNDEDDKEEEMKEEAELDTNGRYVFALYEDSPVNVKLKEMFPNSIFTDKSINLAGMNIDMVVVLTNYIKHPPYLSLKKQCTDYGIPFTQCTYSNAELIKQKMIEEFSKLS